MKNQARKNIIWLASYPKSGNTWFRVFLINLLYPSEQPADINRLEKIQVASSRRLFDENMALCSSDLTHDEIDRLRPELYRQLSKDASGPFYLKIHDAYIMVEDKAPLVPPEVTRCALYFIRNPLDVAVSFAHHGGESIDEIIRWMEDEDFALCADPGRLDIQLRQRLGSWSRHVSGWTGDAGFPVHVLRYEDMLAAPHDTFTAALDFAGIEAARQQVEKALRFSRFDVLKGQERETGFNERHPASPSFFRQGKSGVWKEALTSHQVRQIVERHYAVMDRFGYLDRRGQPV